MTVVHLGWRPYPARTVWHMPHINGELLTWADFAMPQLNTQRDVHVLLPPSYRHESSRHYPVLYMQDGQNLFDDRMSFGGHDWRVDDTMRTLASEGLEAIIVAVNHGNDRRVSEYNPFAHVWSGSGAAYVRFLVDTLKPTIDSGFRTLPGRAHTGIIGSSMGGLIATYAFFAVPPAFGMMAALSPAYWIGGGAIHDLVERAPKHSGRLYLDNGTRENSARRMSALLIGKGYERDRDVKYVVEEGAEHNEQAWARRLPEALRFLLRA